MNNNKIKSLLRQIDYSSAITVDDSPMLTTTDIDVITGDPDNEVLSISWCDDEQLEYEVVITEQGLSDAEIYNNEIKCVDIDGVTTTISLFNYSPKEISINW